MTLIVGVSGSLSETSNSLKGLLVSLRAAEKEGANVGLLDLRELPMPIYNPNEDSQDANVAFFRQAFANADGYIIASPEYHNTFSGVLKNALDFVGARQIKNKPVGLIAASGGVTGISTLIAMQSFLRSLHGWIIPTLGSIGGNVQFTPDGQFCDAALQTRFETIGRHAVRVAAAFRTVDFS